MNKPKLTILCGIPGCGKTTWIEKNKKSNQIVISLDDVRREIFGHKFHRPSEPWIIAFAKSFFRLLLIQKKNIIIDATNIFTFMRKEWKEVAIQYDYKTELVIFDIPFKVCLKRNKLRPKEKRLSISEMGRFCNMFQKPDLFYESYDKVITIKE